MNILIKSILPFCFCVTMILLFYSPKRFSKIKKFDYFKSLNISLLFQDLNDEQNMDVKELL